MLNMALSSNIVYLNYFIFLEVFYCCIFQNQFGNLKEYFSSMISRNFITRRLILKTLKIPKYIAFLIVYLQVS